MTVNELLEGLNSTGIRFAHFAWSHSPDENTYGVFSETDYSAQWSNNHKGEEKITGEIDLFTRDDTDAKKMLVENVLDSLGCGYKLSNIDYEDDTGFIHYTWDVDAHYG